MLRPTRACLKSEQWLEQQREPQGKRFSNTSGPYLTLTFNLIMYFKMVFERPISALLSRVIDAAHSSRSNGGRSPSKLNERNLGSVAFQEQEPRGLESDLQGLRTNSATGMSETLMASRAARQSHLSQRDAKRTKDGRRLSTTSFNFDSNVNEDASESPNLEMTIEYDKNQSLPPFQRDSTGHSHEQIGPIGYLFRWYVDKILRTLLFIMFMI